MSGTSWFDLASIQDQITKSIQEAAKIAEDASRYDILNFDEMAKHQDDEDAMEYESGDEQDAIDDRSTQGAVAPAQINHGVRSFDYDHNDVHSSTIDHKILKSQTSRDPTHYHSQIEETPLKKKNSKDYENEAHGFSDISLNGDKDENWDDGFASNSFFRSPPSTSKPSQIDKVNLQSETWEDRKMPPTNGKVAIGSYERNSGTNDASATSGDTEINVTARNNYMDTDGENDRDRERDWDNTNITNNNGISMESSSTSASAISSTNHEFGRTFDSISTPVKEGRATTVTVTATTATATATTEDPGDDFFEDQFKGIHTVKKDKPPRSSSYLTKIDETTSSSIEESSSSSTSVVDGQSSLLGKSSIHTQNATNPPHSQHSTLNSSDAIIPTIRPIKEKNRKKKKKKGGLDFFGMGSGETSDSVVPLPLQNFPAPVNNFTFFEPVGMLNDEVEEDQFDDSALHSHSQGMLWQSGTVDVSDNGSGSGSGSAVGSSSVSRMTQRLPGLTFNISGSNSSSSGNGSGSHVDNGTMSLSSASTAAGKVLFSFFDNVEEEIDSSQDPILLQVAYNKANPHSRSQAYSNPLNIFGIQFSNTVSVQKNGHDVDLERSSDSLTGGQSASSRQSFPFTTGNNNAGNSNESGNTTTPTTTVTAASVAVRALYIVRTIIETTTLFIKAVSACVGTIYVESTNGVGAPLRLSTPHTPSSSGSESDTDVSIEAYKKG